MSPSRLAVIALAVIGAAWIATAAPAVTGGTPASGAAITPDARVADADPDDEDDDAEDEAPVVVPESPPGVTQLDRTRAIRVGFDHPIHDRNVSVSGADPLACVACHPIRARGELGARPDHRMCFGKCHGPSPVRRGRFVDVDARAKVCATCHASTELIAANKGARIRLGVTYPPYLVEADYGMKLSHAAHAATPCVTCHVQLGKVAAPRPAVHARCSGCHTGKTARAPAMAECAGCHVPSFGKTGPQMLDPDLYTAFDHAGHGRVAPAACTTCHRTIAATAGIELARPRAADCATAGCHDGGKAFAVIVACTRCHPRAPADPWIVARPPDRFSHRSHAARIGSRDCASCHRLDRRGEPATIGHLSCGDSACHADDFIAREPMICGACHRGSEPWRVLPVDQGPLPETEHGARLPHDRHVQPCITCHRLATDERELRPPRGHAACASAGCHAAAAGPAPRLGACAACHQVGLVEARTHARLAAPWSVRARFTHARHATDPRGGVLECTACHDAMATTKDVADVPTPAKARCTGCHDGTIAFKVTGTGCMRCHGKAPGSRLQAPGP